MTKYANMSDAELKQQYFVVSKEVSKYNNFQMAKKILMNSLYGAAGNEGFRFYDPRMAEGITITGQYFIRAVADAIDDYLSKITKSHLKSTFYIDTDSCYVTMESIVEKFIIPKLGENPDIQKIIDAMDKIANEKITPVINTACDGLSDYTNSLKQLMNFKRESLADKGVWCCHPLTSVDVNGSTIPISDVWDVGTPTDDDRIRSVGGTIINFDILTQTKKHDELCYVYRKHYTGEIVEVTTESGVLRLTPEHLVLVKCSRGYSLWKPAGKLTTCDEILCIK